MHTKHTSTNDAQAARMPTWFIPHGAGPCFFMKWKPADAWDAMAHYLKNAASTLPQRPRAIVLVSAHWLAPAFTVSGNPNPGLIFDYHGFPPHTYELAYAAPGEPELAARVSQLINQAGLTSAQHPTRGFDHGMFIPMMLMFPDADIPVIQLSLNRNLDPAAHLQVGQALAPLRDDGVLIIGSGMSFHNMRGYGGPRFGPISDEFDTWLTQTIEQPEHERHQALVNWTQAPSARQCHPPGAEEHLLPLMVAVGAAGNDTGRRVFSDRVMETTLSAFSFGS